MLANFDSRTTHAGLKSRKHANHAPSLRDLAIEGLSKCDKVSTDDHASTVYSVCLSEVFITRWGSVVPSRSTYVGQF